MNKFYTLSILFIFQSIPLFGMSNWLEKLQDKLFVCNNPQIIAEVKQIINNGSTVKETLTRQILDRQNKAFKGIYKAYNETNRNNNNNGYQRIYSDNAIDQELRQCASTDINTFYMAHAVHDTRLPKQILDYTIARLAERGIDSTKINICLNNDLLTKMLHINPLMPVGTYRHHLVPRVYIVFNPIMTLLPFNILKSIINHEIEHIAQKHLEFLKNKAELQFDEFTQKFTSSEQFLTAIGLFHKECENTADQIPALESIDKARSMKKCMGTLTLCTTMLSGPSLNKKNIFGALACSGISALKAYMGGYNSLARISMAACMGIGSYILGHNLMSCILGTDSHPSPYHRYRALNKIEKYLRAEEYLKKQAHRQKTT